MAETPAVNGEARERVAVLKQRMDDCQKSNADRYAQLVATLERQGQRIDRLEDTVLVMTTRIGMWAAGGAALAGILVQLAFKLFT